MKVIAKFDNLKSISDERLLARLEKYINMPDGELNLETGREYTVYGIVFWDNSPLFYLCDSEMDEFPTPFFAEFFDISDDRLSRFWRLETYDNGVGQISSALVFPEWASNHLFYERLLDGHAEEIELFLKYRKLMDREFNPFENREGQLRSMVSDALLYRWDPIGISEYPEARDEYDSYVGGVCNLLMDGASIEKLFQHLWIIETETMGLGGDKEHTKDFAKKLYRLFNSE
ncbi:hypothetical protein [uncultured Sneathiella sp.]|uniref:hypothetical protein n=1 Tax=uncultured Sneathiella sp. TaxID=879315 RepID=UPI0030ED51CD